MSPLRGLVPLALVALSACSIPLDTRLHAGAGGVAYAAQSAVLPDTLRANPLERCAFAAAAGLAKEAWDSTGQGQVEARDVAATVLGCIAVDAVVQIVQGRHPWTGQPR